MNSGRFRASQPSLYHKDRGYQGIRRYQNSHAVADSWRSFRRENVQPPLPSYTSPYAMTLVQPIQKLEEYIKLAEKLNTSFFYQRKKDTSLIIIRKFIEYAKMRIKEGDYTLLDAKLEQLRMADKMLNS